MSRLHRLPYYTHQVVAQGIQVCFVPELGGEGIQGLPRIVLPTVETTVDEGLDATPQRGEEGRDKQGGGDCEGGLLASEKDEYPLQHHDSTEVECDQRGRE